MRSDHNLAYELAARVSHLAAHPLPREVEREAQRAPLNSLATAIAGCRAPAVVPLIEVGRFVTGRATASVPGTSERFDAIVAALVTGAAGHVLDFDDTHLATFIHPGPSLVGTVLPVAEWRGNSGRDVLAAFALGCEVELRAGLGLTVEHYRRGWHVTGTCGVIGTAVAASLLLGHDPRQLAGAVGIAVSQTLGHQEGLGTGEKALHAGKAASNGILAALLADAGFTAPPDAFRSPGGFFDVLSDAPRPDELVDDLGERWELLADAYKPYPCAIVCHPVIDAARSLATLVEPANIESVVVQCNPLAIRLAGNPEPRDGLEARLSIAHGVAVALLDGEVGLAQYADPRVVARDVHGLRRRVTLKPVAAVAADEAIVEIRMRNGSQFYEHIAHARGSRDRPLEDAELNVKVESLVEAVLPGRSEQLIAAATGLPNALNITSLIQAATP